MRLNTLQVHLPSLTVFQNWPTSGTPLGHVTAVDFSPRSEYTVIGNSRGRVLLYHLKEYGIECQNLLHRNLDTTGDNGDDLPIHHDGRMGYQPTRTLHGSDVEQKDPPAHEGNLCDMAVF